MNNNQFPKSPVREKINVLSGRDIEWPVLVDFRRNEIAENTIHGAISWFSGGKLVHSVAGGNICYGRSTMKPVYIKAFAKDLLDLSDSQKAIALASHNGWSEQVQMAKSILKTEDQHLMKTPEDLPLISKGEVVTASPWINNSSGHHAALLKASLKRGYSAENYTHPDQPIYKEYLKTMKDFLGEDYTPLRIARDGDGLPTLAMTVNDIAKCYAGLAATKNEDWIWEAFVKTPLMIGGEGRLDTSIIQACHGKVIAKEGADGLLAMSILHPDFKDGLGIAIKIAHGWNPQATWYIARSILGVLGFELSPPKTLRRQKAFLVENIVPENYFEQFLKIPTWATDDPNIDRWEKI